MANYKEIFETCSILLFIYVIADLIEDMVIISLIALVTRKFLCEASQIYDKRWDKILKWASSFLTSEEEEKKEEKKTTIIDADIPETPKSIDSLNDLNQGQSPTIKKSEVAPLEIPTNRSTPDPPVVSSSTISSLLTAITTESSEISGRTWELFYLDTVYKRGNSLWVEWRNEERFEAWVRRNGWIALTEEEIETLERWRGWLLLLAFPMYWGGGGGG
ncbi:predicted protein [Sclerotinia sclerotiorum 1980 UF-70]|uniref:Uncharacterized protein n=1 Tax=Sclerotinia sclerotiorum (strain ATCC 18683 / 1980 / Ss-1) TaxID=665079 RepID=A7F384_SCLS1|nr:predicted protein [Sclerotinia sclerotiorum 1980 UF-70]EDN97205.1 predicted protein [Sclerotinia sclerotiorum 1980 UF-70]